MYKRSIAVGIEMCLVLFAYICVGSVGYADGTNEVFLSRFECPILRVAVDKDISEIQAFVGAGGTNLVQGGLSVLEGRGLRRKVGKRLCLTENEMAKVRKAMLKLRAMNTNQHVLGAIAKQLSWGIYQFLTAEKTVSFSGRAYRSSLSCGVYSNDVCRMQVFRGDEIDCTDYLFLHCEGISDLTREIIAEHAKQEKSEGIESKEGNQRSPDTNGKDDSTAGIQAESKDRKKQKE